MQEQNAYIRVSGRLRDELSRKGVSLRELSDFSDVPYRTLQEYVADKRAPGADALLRMCAALRVNPLWLLTGLGKRELQVEPGQGLILRKTDLVAVDGLAIDEASCEDALYQETILSKGRGGESDMRNPLWEHKNESAAIPSSANSQPIEEFEDGLKDRVEQENGRLRIELQRVQAQLQSLTQRTAEQDLFIELGLHELYLRARRGHQETAWNVLNALAARHPETVTFDELLLSVQFSTPQSELDLRSDLAVLKHRELVKEGEGGWSLCTDSTVLAAREAGDVSQATHDAVRTLVNEVVPIAERRQGRGCLLTGEGFIRPGTTVEFVEAVRNSVQAMASDYRCLEGEGEPVTIVLGVSGKS